MTQRPAARRAAGSAAHRVGAAPARTAPVRKLPSSARTVRNRGAAAAVPVDGAVPPDSGPLRAILRAAGELLDERGTDGLNTTAIAQRAGISTATLYRLFPDKHAVLRALVLDLQQERASRVMEYYEAVITAPDWREPLNGVLRVAYALRLARPGGRSTRRALQTSPELWQWDQQQSRELWIALARALNRRKPSLGKATAERIAMVTVTTTVALLDLACDDERHAERILREAIELRNAYLSRYLD